MRLHAILSAGGLGLQTGKEKDTEFSHRTLMANTLFLYFPTLTANAAFLLNGGRRGTGLGGPAGTCRAPSRRAGLTKSQLFRP